MKKHTELLTTQGNCKVSDLYLLEYQRCILLSLEQEGLLDHQQLEECIIQLKNQYH